MPLLHVSFDWPVCEGGYMWTSPEPEERAESETILEKEIRDRDAAPKLVAKDDRERIEQPFNYYDSLYGELAKLDGSEESCIGFANRFGLLGILGAEDGETLFEWQDAIAKMAQAIELSRSNPKALVGYQIAPPHVSLVPSPPDGRLRLRLAPISLLHGMQLQFAQAISSDLAIKECRLCGKWFEAGGEKRRRDAQFCSKKCKIDCHNLEKRRVTR